MFAFCNNHTLATIPEGSEERTAVEDSIRRRDPGSEHEGVASGEGKSRLNKTLSIRQMNDGEMRPPVHGHRERSQQGSKTGIRFEGNTRTGSDAGK
ncbi:MAG: hypothetical protein ACYDAM_08650 [Leptospirales bacterium]